MKFRISASGFVLGCALFLASCSDPMGPGPRCPSGNFEDCWVRIGLEGENIRGIQATRWGVYVAVSQQRLDPDTGGLFRLDEATGTWEQMRPSAGGMMYVPGSEPRMYAALGEGFYVTEDGETWRRMEGFPLDRAMSLGRDARDPNRIYLGGAMYIVFESRDGGETWRYLHQPPDYNFSGLVFFVGRSPHGRIWYGGEAALGFEDMSGDLFYSDDDGATWTTPWPYTGRGPRPDAPPILRDIVHHPTDPNTTVVLATAHILRTTDGGQSWRKVPHNSRGFSQIIDWNDTLYVIGNDLLASNDFGRTWSRPIPFPVSSAEYRWVNAASIDVEGRLYVATSDGMWRFEGVLSAH